MLVFPLQGLRRGNFLAPCRFGLRTPVRFPAHFRRNVTALRTRASLLRQSANGPLVTRRCGGRVHARTAAAELEAIVADEAVLQIAPERTSGTRCCRA